MIRTQRARPAGRHDPNRRPLSPTRVSSNGAREHLTISEVCAELKISRSTFYYWRQTGKAPRCLVLPNREVRVTRDDLDTWLDAHTEVDA